MFNFRKFWESTRRILTVSKKPDMDEFKVMSKVTGLGIILIGVIGFVIMLTFIMLGIK
ncbi:MAG: protein translocase SEC61 complex subunit gamma [archaeon]|nr:protein translocase SEC61 complex subunit gamma [Candidatus Micrarchaeota archaeon]